MVSIIIIITIININIIINIIIIIILSPGASHDKMSELILWGKALPGVTIKDFFKYNLAR